MRPLELRIHTAFAADSGQSFGHRVSQLEFGGNLLSGEFQEEDN